MKSSDNSFMQFAKCGDLDTNFFFPEDVRGINAAIAFCQDCVVKTACAEYAIENKINHGIFGGLSVRGRNRMKRQNRGSVSV